MIWNAPPALPAGAGLDGPADEEADGDGDIADHVPGRCHDPVIDRRAGNGAAEAEECRPRQDGGRWCAGARCSVAVLQAPQNTDLPTL